MTPGTHRFVALDALRGLCAVLVCLFHFKANSPIAESQFVRSSWQYVDFFFVLSGFVIAANYRQRLEEGLSPWRFLGLRLGRIYPLHIFVLGLFVVTEIAGAILLSPGQRPRQMFDTAHAPSAIILHLLMLHSVGLTSRLTWNDPAWSIGVEFWTYVVFALAVPWLRTRLEAVMLVVVVACPLILLGVRSAGINVTWDWGLVRCIYGFSLGVLGWAVWRREGRATDTRPILWTVLELTALVASAGFVMATMTSQWNVLGPLVFAVAVLIFAHERGRVSRLLATPPLLLLGTLSYSIYMLHSFVQARSADVLKIIERLTGYPTSSPGIHNGVAIRIVGATPLQGTLLTGMMLLIVIGLSYITYRTVELPGQRWARERLGVGAKRSVADPRR